MSSKPNGTSRLHTRIVKLVIPILGPKADSFVRFQLHLHRNKGQEFMVNRSKAVWNIALLLKSGEMDKAITVARNNRIALKANGIPRGLEGTLVSAFVSARRPSVLRRASAALRWYTGFYATKATEAQLSKSRKSINTPGKELTFSPSGFSWTSVPVLAFMKQHVSLVSKRKLPHINSLSGASSYPGLFRFKPADSSAWLHKNGVSEKRSKRLTLPFEKMIGSLLTKGRVPDSLVQAFGENSLRNFAAHYQALTGDDTYGKITVLQEAGNKGRIVCMPNAWVALYTKWHQRVLSDIIGHLESNQRHLLNGISCVNDQQRGAYHIQMRMNEGARVFAVDQSSATDRFPLSLQQRILDHIGMSDLATALDDLRGPYISPEGGVWSYLAGQPMGLPPSFPLYHLTHIHFVEGIISDLGLPQGIHYCILGDDIVIFNERLAEEYRRRLAVIGVDISEHKSFSGDVTEFAGFVFTGKPGEVSAFRPYKHTRNFRRFDVLNVTHAYGKSVKSWSGNWSKKFDAYHKTRDYRHLDLSPLWSDESEQSGKSVPVSVDYLLSITNRINWRETPVTSEFPLDPQRYLSLNLPKFLTELVQGYNNPIQNGDFGSFDPYLYLQGEITRKEDWRSHFKIGMS